VGGTDNLAAGGLHRAFRGRYRLCRVQLLKREKERERESELSEAVTGSAECSSYHICIYVYLFF
jgi:hypothetical protein